MERELTSEVGDEADRPAEKWRVEKRVKSEQAIRGSEEFNQPGSMAKSQFAPAQAWQEDRRTPRRF